MIRLSAKHLEEIGRHAEREYPHECCGLLVGRIEDEGRTRVVLEIYPVSNAWEETGERGHRMLISPTDYMRAERLFSERGLGVVGDYHSHPDHPAVPSQFDLDHAPWPTMSYIVVSVLKGRAADLRSWEMDAERTRFEEEPVVKGD
jgi:proteasome lid subunit RPN8/RPN11